MKREVNHLYTPAQEGIIGLLARGLVKRFPEYAESSSLARSFKFLEMQDEPNGGNFESSILLPFANPILYQLPGNALAIGETIVMATDHNWKVKDGSQEDLKGIVKFSDRHMEIQNRRIEQFIDGQKNPTECHGRVETMFKLFMASKMERTKLKTTMHPTFALNKSGRSAYLVVADKRSYVDGTEDVELDPHLVFEDGSSIQVNEDPFYNGTYGLPKRQEIRDALR